MAKNKEYTSIEINTVKDIEDLKQKKYARYVFPPLEIVVSKDLDVSDVSKIDDLRSFVKENNVLSLKITFPAEQKPNWDTLVKKLIHTNDDMSFKYESVSITALNDLYYPNFKSCFRIAGLRGQYALNSLTLIDCYSEKDYLSNEGIADGIDWPSLKELKVEATQDVCRFNEKNIKFNSLFLAFCSNSKSIEVLSFAGFGLNNEVLKRIDSKRNDSSPLLFFGSKIKHLDLSGNGDNGKLDYEAVKNIVLACSNLLELKISQGALTEEEINNLESAVKDKRRSWPTFIVKDGNEETRPKMRKEAEEKAVAEKAQRDADERKAENDKRRLAFEASQREAEERLRKTVEERRGTDEKLKRVAEERSRAERIDSERKANEARETAERTQIESEARAKAEADKLRRAAEEKSAAEKQAQERKNAQEPVRKTETKSQVENELEKMKNSAPVDIQYESSRDKFVFTINQSRLREVPKLENHHVDAIIQILNENKNHLTKLELGDNGISAKNFARIVQETDLTHLKEIKLHDISNFKGVQIGESIKKIVDANPDLEVVDFSGMPMELSNDIFVNHTKLKRLTLANISDFASSLEAIQIFKNKNELEVLDLSQLGASMRANMIEAVGAFLQTTKNLKTLHLPSANLSSMEYDKLNILLKGIEKCESLEDIRIVGSLEMDSEALTKALLGKDLKKLELIGCGIDTDIFEQIIARNSIDLKVTMHNCRLTGKNAKEFLLKAKEGRFYGISLLGENNAEDTVEIKTTVNPGTQTTELGDDKPKIPVRSGTTSRQNTTSDQHTPGGAVENTDISAIITEMADELTKAAVGKKFAGKVARKEIKAGIEAKLKGLSEGDTKGMFETLVKDETKRKELITKFKEIAKNEPLVKEAQTTAGLIGAIWERFVNLLGKVCGVESLGQLTKGRVTGFDETKSSSFVDKLKQNLADQNKGAGINQ